MECTIGNKIRIAERSSLDLLLKLWNVSRFFRTRLKHILKDKTLVLKSYNRKALNISNKLKKKDYPIEYPSDPEPGIANYRVRTVEQLNKLKEIDQEINCIPEAIEDLGEACLNVADTVKIDKSLDDWGNYSKLEIKRVKHLELVGLSAKEIEPILRKLKQIDKISFKESDLGGINIENKHNIQEIQVNDCNLTGTVKFPKLTALSICNTKNFPLIECPSVSELSINACSETEEFYNWMRRLENLKKLCVRNVTFPLIFKHFPEDLRSFVCDRKHDLGDLTELKHLRGIVSMASSISLEKVDSTSIREFGVGMQETDKKPKMRPYRVFVMNSNVDLINKYPEILSKCKEIVILSRKFDFSHLPWDLKDIKMIDWSSES